jgi:uncharacterized integral membrane protein (TIGR00697 family)
MQVPENPVKNRTLSARKYNALVILAALMVATYITSNVMAVKVIELFNISIFDAGTITFPLAYMIGDVITEVYGFKTARKLIFLTFFCNILFVCATSLGILFPYPEYMEETQAAYTHIFGFAPRILCASLIAFLTGELLNSLVLVKIKQKTGKRLLWVRTVGSSAVGHFVDTVIFVIAACAGVSPVRDLVSMILIQYIAKLIIEGLGGTPLAYAVVKFIEKQYN